MAHQWVFNAPKDLTPAKSFKQGKQVKFCINNQVATIAIPSSKLNKGYEELTTFMTAHPLRGAYFNSIPHIYPVLVMEWWYTCSANSTNTAIVGTINNGKHKISINQELIRNVLDLPSGENFIAIPSKEVARSALSKIGYNKTKGALLMSGFSSRWKFLISGIIRSLGGKSGSTGELNEFEMQILSSFVTGVKINYAELYFLEFLKLVNESNRIFNVPFIRIISLCFHKVLSESVYMSLNANYADIPVPILTSKVFLNTILENEVPITAAMQHWIDHPYVFHMEGDNSSGSEGSGSHSKEDSVAEGEHTDSGSTDSSSPESDSNMSESVSLPLGSAGKLSSNSEDMIVDIPSQSTQSSPTKESLQTTNPSKSPLTLENIPYSQPPNFEAHLNSPLEILCAVVHSTAALLEPVVPMTTTQTEPEPIRLDILDHHISTTAQTHAVSIEEDAPILSSTTPTPTSLNMSMPILTTSPVLVHIPVSPSYTPAQTANAPVISQTEAQVSNPSVPDDTIPYHQGRFEGAPPSPSNASDRFPDHRELCEAEDATQEKDLSDPSHFQHESCERQTSPPTFNPSPQTQSVPSSITSDVLLAINRLSERVQTELNNNKKEMAEMKGLISTMVSRMDRLEEVVMDTLQALKATPKSNDDVKKGEKFEEPINVGGEEVRENEEEVRLEGETKLMDVQVEGETQSVAQTEEIIAQTEGVMTEVLDITPLQTKKRKGAQPLMIKRAKKMKKMAVRIPSPKHKGESRLKNISMAQVLKIVEREEEREEERDDDEEESDFSPACSYGSPDMKRFDEDDDDDAPIGTLFKNLQKGKSGGSMSSQTETQHQESTQDKEKEEMKKREAARVLEELEEELVEADPEMIKIKEKLRRREAAKIHFKRRHDKASDTSSINQAITNTAAELNLSTEEYIEKVKEAEQKFQEDKSLQAKLIRQNVLNCQLQDHYIHQHFKESLIMNCNVYKEGNRIRIDYRLSNHKKFHVYSDHLHTLGFIEWKYIARFIKSLNDKALKEEIMGEIILLVEVAHDLGKLSESDYCNFCISFNIKKNKRPVGLQSEDLNHRLRPMPKGLSFDEDKYVQTEDDEGFMYKDPNGVECFQSVSSLHNTAYYHLFGLLDLCKDKQSLPFRKKVVRCLFYHLSDIEKDPVYKSKCSRIRKEHRKNEKDNLAEVERIERLRRH